MLGSFEQVLVSAISREAVLSMVILSRVAQCKLASSRAKLSRLVLSKETLRAATSNRKCGDEQGQIEQNDTKQGGYVFDEAKQGCVKSGCTVNCDTLT